MIEVKNGAAKIFEPAGQFNADELIKLFNSFGATLAKYMPELNAAAAFSEIAPYLIKELEKEIAANPEIADLPLLDLIEVELDENGNPKASESILERLIKRAAAQLKQEQPANVTANKVTALAYPLDKFNHTLWNSLTPKQTAGRIGIEMAKASDRKKGLSLKANVFINFDDLGDDLKITKTFTPYDERVYIAVAALFDAGNDVISLTQIYNAMGNTNAPNKRDREKIFNSLLKMGGTFLRIENAAEAKKYNYEKINFSGHLLDLRTRAATINGKTTNQGIYIMSRPVLVEIAEARGQFTTIKPEYLTTSLSQTNENLALEDYLIWRISRAANSLAAGKKKTNRERILYKKIFERAGIKTSSQKTRAREKVKKLLIDYKSSGLIERYTIQPDGVAVFLKKLKSTKRGL